MEKRKRDAFTLVELIIVIMIIGVLAGLLYLVVRPSGDMASEKVCSSNRATVMLAFDAYRSSSGVNRDTYTLQNFIDDKYEARVDEKGGRGP